MIRFTGTTGDWQVPTPPDSAMDLMPEETDSFWEGVWEIVKKSMPQVMPSLSECLGICVSLFAIVLLLCVLQTLPGSSKWTADVAGACACGILLLKSSNALVNLGAETVRSISEYGKALLPVMTAMLAGGGGLTASGALYGGTVFFDALLGAVCSGVLIPMIHIFLCLAVVKAALGESSLEKLADFMKWLMTWSLKIILYVFTGYMSITGVISGAADAAAVKAAKLTISGMVPVVGGILSDASETILVSAGVIRSAAGIYGLLAAVSVCIQPFLRIGVQYLLLKITGAVSSVFGKNQWIGLIKDFTWCMGLLLAMTGTACLLIMVSVICFMQGVG